MKDTFWISWQYHSKPDGYESFVESHHALLCSSFNQAIHGSTIQHSPRRKATFEYVSTNVGFFKKKNECIITGINVSENQWNIYKGLGGIILYSPRFTAFKGHTFHSWLVGSLFWFWRHQLEFQMLQLLNLNNHWKKNILQVTFMKIKTIL